ncbi:Vps62-related protein [Kibdelosporangium phytohabitans]|uniref:DUF946 domain-containing protein n=1 Tax=Kibdelosporangium phytohabitans TaxID=860235 RepID=A0A0N9I4G3_9PSEU|nr:Vps62-related protein [Kibdelosporangium phytohabitans]ALG09699.1 hypothetical protein AOZ06_24840 [Kibdelosporangium phytohabitans]MBE1468945.1 hypothetical protein [Kibdelosporangium phytohabitans]
MSEIQEVRPVEHADLGGEPTLLVGTTSTFKWVWSDSESGSRRDVTIWRPQPTDGYQLVGDYAQGNYNKHPNATAITVKSVNDGNSPHPILMAPQRYVQIWKDKGSRGKHNGAIWFPEPPDGYVSLGYVATKGFSAPKNLNYACIRRDWAREAGVGPSVWSDAKSGADEAVTAYPIIGVSAAFVAQGNYDKWVGTAWQLNLQSAHEPELG